MSNSKKVEEKKAEIIVKTPAEIKAEAEAKIKAMFSEVETTDSEENFSHKNLWSFRKAYNQSNSDAKKRFYKNKIRKTIEENKKFDSSFLAVLKACKWIENNKNNSKLLAYEHKADLIG